MGRSRLSLVAATGCVLAVGLSGCVETTQQKSARAQLRAERLLASRVGVRVKQTNTSVSVVRVGLVRSGTAAAIAVVLRNDGPKPASDLPISVGERTPGGRAVYLNADPGLAYFQTHVGAIGAGAVVTWVYAASRPTAATSEPFAKVGNSSVPVPDVASLPTLSVSPNPAPPGDPSPGTAYARLTNRSDVPQYDLDTYASAWSGDRLLAAGLGSVATLGSAGTANVALRLVGSPGAVPLGLDAPPTVLR